MFIYFSITKFKEKMNKLVLDVLSEVRKETKDNLIKNLNNIKFNTNVVHIAGRPDTSDAKRKRALINSVVATRVGNRGFEYFNFILNTMKNNPNDAYIGIYYESGTGIYKDKRQIEAPWMSKSVSSNSFRIGKDLYTRSKYLSYDKGPGRYTDLGGNVRETYSPRAGHIMPPSWSVKPTRWFTKEYDKIDDMIDKKFRTKIKEVNFNDCIKVTRKIILGR